MKPKSPAKKSMQNVKFDSIDELLEFLPEDQLKLTEFLRKLIFQCVPEIEEKLSFNVPFYRRNKGIFFIWPGAVSWGKVTHEGVRLGFQQGYRMSDEIGYLDRGNRKQVFYRDFKRLQDIDVELLTAYLYEAVLADGEVKSYK